jgi:hypothetical protein
LISVLIGPHVRPPFVDLDTVIALALFESLNASAMKYAVPSGENVTQGSDTRS